MKVLILLVDGSPAPAVRGLKLLNREEDYLVLLSVSGARDPKNLVKDLAALPPSRVAEVVVGKSPAFTTRAVESVFKFLSDTKIPYQTEILLLPTTGWGVVGSTPKLGRWGGGEEWDNLPSPILPALVTGAALEAAKNAPRGVKIVLAEGENLRWVVGGRVEHAPLNGDQWKKIAGHVPATEKRVPFADFWSANGTQISWGYVSHSKNAEKCFAAGFGEASGRVVWIVAHATSNAKELKLFALEEILKMKNRGVDIPVVVAGYVRDTQKMSQDISELTWTCVHVIDMGEDPLRDPAVALGSFLRD